MSQEKKFKDLPPDLLSEFKDELLENVDVVNKLFLKMETEDLSDDDASDLKRKIHNLKGHSGYLKLSLASETSHILENILLAVDSGLYEKNDMIDLLLETAKELQIFFQNIEVTDDDIIPQNNDDLEILLMKLKLFNITEKEIEEKKKKNSVKKKKTTSKKNTSKPVKKIKIKKNYLKYDYKSRSQEDIKMFIDEAHEMLDDISNTLLNLEKNKNDKSAIEALFRVLHTLKGASGMLELLSIGYLSHSLEELLELIRADEMDVTNEIVDMMFEGIDKIQELIQKFETGSEVNVNVDSILEKIEAIKTGHPISVKSEPPAPQPETKENAAVSTAPVKKPVKDIPKTITLQTLRIDVTKIDNVLNRMGELVIEKIKLQTFLKDFFNYENRLTYVKNDIVENGITPKTENNTIDIIDDFEVLRDKLIYICEGFDRLSSELQDGIMKMRLVPLSQLFSRFPRVVRDLSKQLDKEIDFNIEGEDTEIDKNIIESLMDPLVHIIRNSIDHGIEPVQLRKQKGKSRSGKILLKAYYKGNNVVIEIIDDGAGLNVDKIKHKCIQKNLIDEDILNQMSDEEIMQQIFRPGFSTAEKVTDLSGRGVGMDVVRKTIEDLNGTVLVRSEINKYSTVLITIPLTLAIMQVLLVKISDNILAIPLYTVQETVYTDKKEIYDLSNKLVFNFRDKVIPLVDLKSVLGIDDLKVNNDKRVNEISDSDISLLNSNYSDNRVPIALINFGDKEYGFIIDEFEGKQEIVIKGLGTLLEKVPFVSGATTMGDGSVVLILDVMAIIRQSGNYSSVSNFKEEIVETKTRDDISLQPKKKVLIVDDSKAIRLAIRNILKKMNIDIDEAENGKDAFEKAAKEDYDLISTDILMPEMDGYKLCEKLRQQEKYKKKPIIAISRKGEKVSKIRGFQCGIDEYLVKPVNNELFKSVIEKYLY